MNARKKLFSLSYPYQTPSNEFLFFHSMKEITSYHIKHNPAYRQIAKEDGFATSMLKSPRDLHKIPPIPTLYLKKHPSFSVPPKKVVLKTTTSGTSGKKSVVGYDVNSGLLDLQMAVRTLSYHKLFSKTPTNYLILGYPPSLKEKTGISRTIFSFTLLAPAVHREYALKQIENQYELNLEGMIKSLLQYEKQKLPVRMIGLPAYHYMLLTELKKRNIVLRLNPDSLLCLSGGWKQFYFEEADKNELYRLAEEHLCIKEENCYDFFGAVEHPIIYCDCPHHHFHIPAYSRVIVRDVDTLVPLPYDRAGLLNLLSPLMKSMPLHSIITDDLAILHRGEECGCGNTAPFFELLGRAGLQDLKTCAAGASQYLNADLLSSLSKNL